MRAALLHAQSDSGARLTGSDVDSVVEGFRGRRALAKGMFGKEPTKRGDVFRYKEFLGSLAGVEKDGQGGKAREAAEA